MRFTKGLGRHVGRRRHDSLGSNLEADAATAGFRAGIIGSSQGSHLPPPPEAEQDPGWVDPGLVEHTRPDERPHPKAQWDDAAGHWIIWNTATGAWEQIS